MRRKGEQQVPKRHERWSEDSPMALSIATGTHWFDAWIMQQNTPYGRLSSLTGIPAQRFMAITMRDAVSRAEIDALACACSTSPNDLIASMGGRTEIVD